MLFLVLSWGIDYRKKSSETRFGRITSWIYVHPISHCALRKYDENIKTGITFFP
jgi:hypothetical protein